MQKIKRVLCAFLVVSVLSGAVMAVPEEDYTSVVNLLQERGREEAALCLAEQFSADNYKWFYANPSCQAEFLLLLGEAYFRVEKYRKAVTSFYKILTCPRQKEWLASHADEHACILYYLAKSKAKNGMAADAVSNLEQLLSEHQGWLNGRPEVLREVTTLLEIERNKQEEGSSTEEDPISANGRCFVLGGKRVRIPSSEDSEACTEKSLIVCMSGDILSSDPLL